MATPQIPWARVLVEGVVIVASILLAFGIDAWWEQRQDREEERRILQALTGLHGARVPTMQSSRLNSIVGSGSGAKALPRR